MDLPEIARNEADEFKSQAMALINENFEDIVRTGLLDKNDFVDEDGEEIEDIEYEISQKLAYLLSSRIGLTHTAFEIDDNNNEINGKHSIASPNTSQKAYIPFDLYSGDHINGQIILSNTGEAHIIISDKNGKVLHSEKEKVEINHALFSCADGELLNAQRCRDSKWHGDFRLYEIPMDEITEREIDFYLENLDGNKYESMKNHYFHLGDDFESLIENAARALKADGEISYITFGDDDNESRGIIAEHNGNVLYSNKLTGEFKISNNGDEINILDEEFIAEPGVLSIMESKFDGILDMEYYEAEVEYEEPEVKSSNKLKP